MEHPYWLDACEHNERFEYCERELFDDDIGIITDTLEEIVENVRMSSVEFGYSGDKEGALLWRSFEYDFPVSNEQDIFGTRESIEIEIEDCKSPECRVYTVVSSWRLTNADFHSDPVRHSYCFEIYPGGNSHYTVSEIDMSLDEHQASGMIRYVDRPMTGYDLNELMKLLHRTLGIESADPGYIDPDSYHSWARGA